MSPTSKVWLLITATLLVSFNAAAQEKILLTFKNANGSSPSANLIFDAAGNLYGTVAGGGLYGYGMVFELSPGPEGSWKEKMVHSFNMTDGSYPNSGLIFDTRGNLYGTTLYGCGNGYGCVFELSPRAGGGWTETVLHRFASDGSGTDGYYSYGGVVLDASGNLYGTTSYGGTGACDGPEGVGCGTVFELSPAVGGQWTEKLIHNFNIAVQDGYYPQGGLTPDASGNLYGTTTLGGASGEGTVFELSPSPGGNWTETILHNFNAVGDGYSPYANLVFDKSGDLYGTTNLGGANNYGTVFELSPQGSSWTETILHSFNKNGVDGYYPYGGVVFDGSGNLYGTTTAGGSLNGCNHRGCGAVFELIPGSGGQWTEEILYPFSGAQTDGHYPYSSLVLDNSGNVYGTTVSGGAGPCPMKDFSAGCGIVFEITP
jgi:uncharacterized repeat protein (TIGR03803 family)